MQKVFVILGQTATGKSALAVRLAKKLNGEVVSADSRQVYIGLDVGTGKITKKEMRGVKHHLLDVARPKSMFAVVQFQKLANRKIEEIIKQGKTPIICGGTGFYIDSVTKGTVLPEVSPNKKLRKMLHKQSLDELVKILRKLDRRRLKNIDTKNKVRLIRAIEIAKTLGKVPRLEARLPSRRFIKIGLFMPEEKLRKNIKARLRSRMKSGMINEARRLHNAGLSWKRMEELGLEYRYMALYLQKKITKQEMFTKLNSEIFKYAKRQMTWFKRDKEIKWFDASKHIGLSHFV